MTKPVILGTILVATIALTLVLAPGISAYIQSTLGLDDAKVNSNTKKLLVAKYYANGTLTTNTDTWLGVGEFAVDPSGTPTVIATTSHPGFFDSERQSGASDAVWHNHVAALKFTSNCSSGIAVSDLTYESPGNTQSNKNKASIHNVDFGTYTGQLSGLQINATALANTSVLFQLNATNGEVCVVPLDVFP